MKNDESLSSDLIIEPLKLKHLSMLRAENNSKYLGIFQILLCKKWFSSLESSLTNLIPTRNSTCLVAVERYNIIAYILACLLYTSPSPRDNLPSRMPSSA